MNISNRRASAWPLIHWASVLLICLTILGDSTRAEQKSKTREYKGRVIAPVMTAEGGGAEWLERRDREVTEQPEKVLDALQLRPGSTVADIGAGTGYFSLRMARRVGPYGRVLATELQPEMLRLLAENMKKAGIRNIDRILATPNDVKLPSNKVELALMVDVYHELQDPEGSMAQIRRSLTNDGRFVLVEYRAEDPSVPIKPELKTTLRQIRYEIEPMGFRLREVFEFLPHQHVEVFVNDRATGEDVIVDPTDFPTIRKPGWSGASSQDPYQKASFERLLTVGDLGGWTGDKKVWHTEEGMLVGSRIDEKSDHELKSQASFKDFELDLQWIVDDSEGCAAVRLGSNPRLSVWLDAGVPFTDGYTEILATRRTAQVATWPGDKLIQPTSDTARALMHPEAWNRLTVRYSDRRMRIAVNGVETSSFEVESQDPGGQIGLQPVRGKAAFREIWLRPWSSPSNN